MLSKNEISLLRPAINEWRPKNGKGVWVFDIFCWKLSTMTNPEIGMNDHIVYTTFLDELRMLAAKYTHLPIFLQQLSN